MRNSALRVTLYDENNDGKGRRNGKRKELVKDTEYAVAAVCGGFGGNLFF